MIFFTISWYTDEKATEKIYFLQDGKSDEILGNIYPVNKNHKYIANNLSKGDYKVRVYSEDSSGNGNYSEYITINVAEENAGLKDTEYVEESDIKNDKSILELVLEPKNQIIILSFMIIFAVSLFRAYPRGRN